MGARTRPTTIVTRSMLSAPKSSGRLSTTARFRDSPGALALREHGDGGRCLPDRVGRACRSRGCWIAPRNAPATAVADSCTIRSSSTRSITVAFCAVVVPSLRTTILNLTRSPTTTASGSTDLSISSCASGPSSVVTQFRLRSGRHPGPAVSPAYLTVQVTAPFNGMRRTVKADHAIPGRRVVG